MPIDIYYYINLLMKLRITENQYKRLFLKEQYTDADGTFYGAHNKQKKPLTKVELEKLTTLPNYKKYPKDGYPSGFDNDAYNRGKTSEWERLTRNLKNSTPEGAYKRAQGQWGLWGAPNRKTGHNLISDEILQELIPSGQTLEDHLKNDDEDLTVADYNPPIPIDTETGGLSSYIKQNDYNKQMAKLGYESSQNELWKNYMMAQDWNRNIRDQKTLISQYCTKTSDKKWFHQYYGRKGSDNWNRAVQQQKKLGGRVGYYTYDNRYGIYHVYRADISEDPWLFCANKTEKGVFVYNTQAGYMCGCINETSNRDGYLTQHGNFSKQDLLGWSKQFKDYKKENAPGFLENLGEWVTTCVGDYHCLLDVASILALAIPGVGLAVSAGLDFVNAASYGVEAATADNSADRNASILAGMLTLVGGIAGGGVKQTRKIVKYGSKNPKIYNYADEVLERIKKEVPQTKKVPKHTNMLGTPKKIPDDIAKIYIETAEKYGLSESDFLIANDLIREFAKIDIFVANKYTKAMKELESKVGKGNLTMVGKNKKFQSMVVENNGDVITALNKFMRSKAWKEAAFEASLFATIEVAMQKPAVQEWIANKINWLKYAGRDDTQALVEKEGYNWVSTKSLFRSTSSGTDNTLLRRAWKKGWRPYPQGKKEPTEEDNLKSIEWLMDNSKYQTKKFKEEIIPTKKTRAVTPKNDEDRKEGVKYHANQEEVDKFNKMDDTISDEEQDAAYDLLQ